MKHLELFKQGFDSTITEKVKAANYPYVGYDPVGDEVRYTDLTPKYEYVDLGLSVKWATCNVGATKPEDYGDYFAWGETEPKQTFTEDNYLYTGSAPLTLPLSADAAYVNWGGSWRMPTQTEQDELRTECTWEWITQNGVSGCKVTSKLNGNSIFLPAAGYWSSLLNEASSDGYYWSSSLVTYDPGDAYYLYFSLGVVDLYSYNRSFGRSVRPVCP